MIKRVLLLLEDAIYYIDLAICSLLEASSEMTEFYKQEQLEQEEVDDG